MPVTSQEVERYRQFVRSMLDASGSVNIDPAMTLWHYTNGNGFLGIMESGAIRATQVAAVNDSTETVYATRLYRDAVIALQREATDETVRQFFQSVLAETAESADMPGHANSKFYISCFSELEDDINQWLKYGGEHGENGYAIGFNPLGLMGMNPNSGIAKINYDNQTHAAFAGRLAQATLDFYIEGLAVEDRRNDPVLWAKQFFEMWDQCIYRLAPTVKDEGFVAEQEYRLIHEAQHYDLPFIRYQQKASLLGRYIDLKTGGWEGLRVPRLPIKKIMIGPGRHKGITKRSVEGLLEQMGYMNVEVLLSRRALQRP